MPLVGIGQLFWHSRSVVHWATHIGPPVLDEVVVPVVVVPPAVPVEGVPVVPPLPPVPVVALPPKPPVPKGKVSLEAQAVMPAVTRPRMMKVVLAYFTSLW